MEDFWTRLDYDAKDPSTWKEEYVMLPRHREVPVEELCRDAWKAMLRPYIRAVEFSFISVLREVVGGLDRIDPVRNSHHGDQHIFNGGTDYWKDFLDSGSIALTIIHLFTDIEPRGGGTFICEVGSRIKGVCQYLYDHPEGLDPPFDFMYKHVPTCKEFTEITVKAGDTFITHVYLPHSASKNHLRAPRVITNPHVSLKDPFDFNRENPQDYSLVEQVILNALGKSSIPPSEWHITAPRKVYYPRKYTFKAARLQEELDRMIAAALAKGLGPDSVDSIYLKGEEERKKHYERQGLDRPHGPNKFPEGTRSYKAMEIKRGSD